MLEVVHYYSTRCACMQHKSLVSSIDKLISRAFPHSVNRDTISRLPLVLLTFLLFPRSLLTGHTSSQIINFSSSKFWYCSMWQSLLRGWGGSQGEWCIYSYLIIQLPFLCAPQLSFNIIFTKGPRYPFLWGYVNVLSGLLLLSVAFFGGRFCNALAVIFEFIDEEDWRE